jgi:hypothetical protein
MVPQRNFFEVACKKVIHLAMPGRSEGLKEALKMKIVLPLSGHCACASRWTRRHQLFLAGKGSCGAILCSEGKSRLEFGKIGLLFVPEEAAAGSE